MTSDVIATALKYLRSGQRAQAKTLLLSIAARQPNRAEVLELLGTMALEERQGAQAVHFFARAVAVKPAAVVYCQLSNAYSLSGDAAAAVDALRRGVALQPDNAQAYSNLGVLLQAQGRIGEAIDCFRHSAALEPLAETFSNLGCALKDLGGYAQAVEAFERSLSLRPDYPRTYSNLFFCLNHREDIGPEELFVAHLRFGSIFDGLPLLAGAPRERPDPNRRLRLGFVSADLRDHSLAYFLEPIWSGLDKKQAEIWVYSNSETQDRVTARLRALADRWRQVASIGDEELARGIALDRIDILFDLSGHTAGNRLPVFARRPAPIQVSWLGYPGTTGLKAMDYYVADSTFAPEGLLDPFFTEKIVRLPSAGSYEPIKAAPPVNRLPALTRGHFTFGSFNRFAKLTDGSIALWSRILHAVPESRLLLGNVSDERQGEDLARRFGQLGIDRERLDFRPALPLLDYLALHHEVDLILDTFPYAGCTTTVHAAWMGVPVLTLTGQTMPSRLGATTLHQLGLSEFVAHSREEFHAKALAWTEDLQGLEALRGGLRERLSDLPVISGQTVSRALEKGVRIMWQRYLDGLQPAGFEVGQP